MTAGQVVARHAAVASRKNILVAGHKGAACHEPPPYPPNDPTRSRAYCADQRHLVRSAVGLGLPAAPFLPP